MIVRLEKIRTAVVGMGYWGPKFARNFLQHPQFELVAAVDLDIDKAKDQVNRLGASNVKVYQNLDELFQEHELDLAHVAVPPQAHFEISHRFLENRVSVLVEKPVGLNMVDREELVRTAKENRVHLLVDHTYMFTSEFEEMYGLVQNKQIGNPIFYNSTRINLGLIQTDTTVVEDLAVHDIALLDGLLGKLPIYVTCSGITVSPSRVTSTAFATITYSHGFVAQLLISWNSSVKVRQIQLAGSLGMITWDDMAGSEKIKIFNSRIDEVLSDEDVRISYHLGEGRIPSVISAEAIRKELNYLFEVISKGMPEPLNGPEHILRVGKILEALKLSLNLNGEKVLL